MMAKGRIAWIDAARAAGATSIVFLHVLVSTAISFDLDMAHRLAYAALTIPLTRWAVPAFFMVSGYLLLDPGREVGWEKALSHARRMALALMTFGLAFALIEEVVNARNEGTVLGPRLLLLAVKDVLTGRSWDHLWYVYAQLGIYLLLPPLKRLYARVGEKGFALFSAALFIGALVVPTLLRVEVPRLLVGLACFCMGGLLERVWSFPGHRAIGFASLCLMLFVSLRGIVQGVGDEGYIFLEGSFLAALWAQAVLSLLHEHVHELASGSVADRLAYESFGIYIIHPFFIHVLLALLPTRIALVPFLYEAAFTCAVLALSYLSCKACRHIPVVRDIV